MLEKASTVATYGGSATAIIGGLQMNDLAAVVGMAVAVLGFLYNIYHKERMFNELKKKNSITIKED